MSINLQSGARSGYHTCKDKFRQDAEKLAKHTDVFGAEIECVIPHGDFEKKLSTALYKGSTDTGRALFVSLAKNETAYIWPSAFETPRIETDMSIKRDVTVNNIEIAETPGEVILPAAPFPMFCQMVSCVCALLEKASAYANKTCGGHLHATINCAAAAADTVNRRLAANGDRDWFKRSFGRKANSYCGAVHMKEHYATLQYVAPITDNRAHIECRAFSGSVTARDWIMRAAALVAFSESTKHLSKRTLFGTSADLDEVLMQLGGLTSPKTIYEIVRPDTAVRFGRECVGFFAKAIA